LHRYGTLSAFEPEVLEVKAVGRDALLPETVEAYMLRYTVPCKNFLLDTSMICMSNYP
jgi:hypothetical protein